MKITHAATHPKDDNNAANVEFHKVLPEVPRPPKPDSPLIFPLAQTTNQHYSPLKRQLFASCGPTLASIGAGMIFGYSATLLPELQRAESEISVSDTTGSWIASLCLLPTAVGCLLGGFSIEKFGRKKAHILLSIPLLLGWTFIYFAHNLEMLLVGRILSGLSVGLMGPACSVYLSEMSDPKYRGLFLGTPSMALSIGILVIHIIGTFLSWRLTALVSCSIPILCVFCMAMVPESPSWLLSKGKFDEAAKAFKWLRGGSMESEQEFKSMSEKQKQSQASEVETLPFWVKLRLNARKPEFYKPFSIVFLCFFIMQLSGPNTMAFYSVNVMRETLGSGINEYVAMIIIDLLRAFMSIVACFMLKIAKRRFLAIFSGVGTVLSLFSLSGYLTLAKMYPEVTQFSWLSLLFLILYIIFISIGIFPLPWCVNGELLPLAMRGFGSSINTFFNFIWCFVVIKTAPGMFSSFGMEGTFLFYGCICLVGTILIFFVLPETKNKTLVEIEAHFSAKNSNSTSEGNVSA
ncbi:facilitated trehalose transporter Tret1-2 homolog [Culicoides brevitarsis]|uniref:facilitated trehalose transporter Tret1-2 homolog n=1 Tax=Culicoides brevitarsis TaxID=469753 RepID=UPI00307C26F1